jgi:micrococcal nuclease
MGCCAGRTLDVAQAPTWANTVPFIAPVTAGHVIKVYDGDTITVATTLGKGGGQLYRFAVRLAGIDAPELHSRDAEERQAGEAARAALSARILHTNVRLDVVPDAKEKYGRILARVVTAGAGDVTDVCAWMVRCKHAVPYDGGRKRPWAEVRHLYL